MSGSGLLYAAVLGAWAVFLLTRCLKVTPTDIDCGVPEGTVLRRRGEPDPAAGTYSMLRPAVPPAAEPVVKSGVRPVEVVTRPRVSAATARRRRRVLGTLVSVFVPLLTANLLGLLPLWPAAIPAALFVAYLYEVRVRAKKARVTRVAVPPVAAPAGPARIPAQRGTRSRPADSDLTWDPWPSVEVEETKPGPVADIADGWEPRPVPLPTYVTAPKAPRVARRIDVSAGRPWAVADEDDEATQEFPALTDELIAEIEAEMAEQAAAPAEAPAPAAEVAGLDEDEIEIPRAVGE
ncbi:hypothetical protein [Sporichthya polymorpha]|uniref:hypothetical protein n=1 Tax=Sporichthya polymorpha TaxID=35751 RepID=UPI0012EBA95C|nr:hypothetical protein [Sporichthya polymorpha]